MNKDENVLVTYVTSNEFPLYKAKYEATADNTGFCMHYSTDGVIQKGNIIVINEGLQGFKNSVVLHEFFHLIGFYDHTSLRESILNKQGPVPYISPVDLLAFKMIYSPGISPKSSYDDIERHYRNADIRAYVPANDSTSLPDLRIPATILVLFILIRFLLSLKRTGLFSSVLKLGVSAIVCLTVFVVFTLYYDILLGLVS